MRAAVYHPGTGIKIEEQIVPSIGAEEALLKVRACGICGTDVLKVQRALPKKPVVLGHELVGEIIEVGSNVARLQQGDRVVVAHHVPCNDCHYCRHGNHSMCRYFKSSNLDPGGFAEYLRIPAEHLMATTFRVPEDLHDDEALFTEPLACCVRNIRRAAPLPGDFAVIVGMGSIGLMTLQLLKLLNVEVLALDLFETRLALARELGADHCLSGQSEEIHSFIQEHSQGRGADLVVFTAGGGKVFQQAVPWVRDGGALNLFASLSEIPIETSLDTLYHHEITVFSSYSPSPEDLREAHRLLVERRVRVLPLVTHHVPLADLEKAIELITQQQALKIVVHPWK